MPQVNFSELFPSVSTVARGAPNPTIRRALQQMAREFYRRAKAYRYTLAATDVPALATTITLVLPDDTELFAPGDMALNDQPLTATSQSRANSALGRWDNTARATPRPTGVMKVSATALALVPLPSQAWPGGLAGEVILLPTRQAPGLEEEQLDSHGEAIAHGAIAHLASMKGTDWYAPSIIGYYRTLFNDAILAADYEARNEHTNNETIVEYGGL